MTFCSSMAIVTLDSLFPCLLPLKPFTLGSQERWRPLLQIPLRPRAGQGHRRLPIASDASWLGWAWWALPLSRSCFAMTLKGGETSGR